MRSPFGEAFATASSEAGDEDGGLSLMKRDKKTQNRWRITPEALEILEQVYAIDPCPSTSTRESLAQAFGATPRQVQVWFQNKRQRRAAKRKQHEQHDQQDREMDAVEQTPSQLLACEQAIRRVHSGLPNFAALPFGSQTTTAPASASTLFPTGSDSTSASVRPNRSSSNSLADLAMAASRVGDAETPEEPAPAREHHYAPAPFLLPKRDSLAELAMVASRVASFSDLASLSRGPTPSRVVSLADLTSLSRVGSLNMIA